MKIKHGLTFEKKIRIEIKSKEKIYAWKCISKVIKWFSLSQIEFFSLDKNIIAIIKQLNKFKTVDVKYLTPEKLRYATYTFTNDYDFAVIFSKTS